MPADLGLLHAGGRSAACKLFLGWHAEGGRRVHLIGQFAPPVAAIISARKVVSVHRIIGATGGARELTENDRAARAYRAVLRPQCELEPSQVVKV